jgi:DNA-binding response OmpR family regulator
MANLKRERRRILLVDDNEDAREIAALTLEDHTLICACDFDQGLLAARRGYFDLYILDNWLPDGSGVELCRNIREFDPHTPILFNSAAAYARDIREAIRAGAQEYLVKPVVPSELRLAVAQLISCARENAFEARHAEITAVREELAIRQMEIAERLEKAKQKRLRAEEKVLREKAQIAFIAAGGTRGDFAREWPSVFLEEVCAARMSTTEGG